MSSSSGPHCIGALHRDPSSSVPLHGMACKELPPVQKKWVPHLVGKIPLITQPTPVYLPEESQLRGAEVGYSPESRNESDTTID